MKAKVIVIGPKDRKGKTYPDDVTVINTTSHSPKALWTQLSPFFLGPVELWGKHVALTMENGWQYSKVYDKFIRTYGKGKPKLDYDAWLHWAKSGWKNPHAVRYPMGKGAVPEYSLWGNDKYNYIQARAKIYIPLYANAVAKTDAFAKLKGMYRTESEIYLWDFDGYQHRLNDMSLLDVLTCERLKMGHAFVLAMMLRWGSKFYKELS